MKNLKFIPIVAALAFTGVVQAESTGIINLVTQERGVYSVSYEQLAAEGVDLSGISTNSLALSSAGKSVARYISDEANNGFGVGDSISFVADENYTRYSDKTVYTLHIDPSLVTNIPSFTSSVAAAENATSANAFYKRADKKIHWASINPNLKDPYVMDYIQAAIPKSKDYAVDLESPDLNGADATISVVVSGAFNDQHEVEINVNGATAAYSKFSGIQRRTITGKVPASALKSSGNVVTVSLPLTHDAPIDLIAVESITVKYSKVLQAENDSLSFYSSAGINVASGFSTADVSVYQKSRKGINRITPVAAAVSGSYSLAFDSRLGKNAITYVVAKGNELTPDFANVVDIDAAISSGDAEYLIISHADFIGPKLQELVDLRSGKYSTKVVDVAQIYTQYGNGVPSSSSIRSYIDYATKNLGTKMVVLVGGDTNDYHNYSSNSVSHIPTEYAAINAGPQKVNHAPSDAAYGDIDFDGVPDIPVGRLPVRNIEELDNVISKIRTYEQRSYDNIVFAVDKIDAGSSFDFGEQADKIISNLSPEVQANLTLASIDNEGEEAAKETLVSSINQGASLTSWLGHSNFGQWSGGNFFKSADVKNLANFDKPTVMTQFGCWNTYFVHPDGNSMSHVAMLTGKNGAATILGSSTLSLAASEVVLARKFYDLALNKGVTIGEALIDAKQAIGVSSKDADVLLGWQIIGDPAIELAIN